MRIYQVNEARKIERNQLAKKAFFFLSESRVAVSERVLSDIGERKIPT